MRPYSRSLVVAVLSATAFAGCGSDSKKNSDGGNFDSPVLDTSLPDAPGPDVSISADSVDSNPGLADAGASDLVDGDGSLPEDAQGSDGQLGSGVFMTPPSASLLAVVGAPSSPAKFQVSYGGGTPSVYLTGRNKDDFSFTSSCSKLASGDAVEDCEIAVVYNPKAAPATNSVATLTVAVGNVSASAALTGTVFFVDPPSITGNPTDFGTVVVGSTSTELTFSITNNSGESLPVLEISAGPAPFVLVTDNCTGKSLPVKSQCTFTVQFKPAAGDVGPIQGQLKATYATPWPSIIGVTGTAVPPAKLALDPKSLDFGPVPLLQESTPLTLTVSNAGGAPTGALTVDKTGAEFAIKGDTCAGAKLSPAGTSKSCKILVTYTPAAQPSEATGSITVSDTSGAAASPVSATLHGTSVRPAVVVLSPTTVCPQTEGDDPICLPSAATNRFNNVPIGQTTPELTFVVSNMTNPADAADSGTMMFAFSGDAAADFAIVKNNCTSPLVSTTGTPTTCTLTVTFKPSAAGLRKAILVLTTSRGASAQATLEGKGLS